MKSPLCADCCATCCSAQSLAHSGTPYLCFMTTEEVMTRRGKEPAQGLSASQGRPGTGVQAGHIHSPTEPREAPQTGSRLKGRAERTRGRGAGTPSQHRGSWPTFLKHQVRVRLFELLTRTNSCNTTALRVRNYQHPCFTDEQTEAGSAACALDGLLQGPHPSPLRCAVPPLNVHMSREPPGTQEPSWGARGDGGRASRRQPRRPPCHHGPHPAQHVLPSPGLRRAPTGSLLPAPRAKTLVRATIAVGPDSCSSLLPVSPRDPLTPCPSSHSNPNASQPRRFPTQKNHALHTNVCSNRQKLETTPMCLRWRMDKQTVMRCTTPRRTTQTDPHGT